MKKFYLILSLLTLILTGCTDAGKDQTVAPGNRVTLDGSGAKTDLGGTITSYTWEQLPQDGVETVHIFDRYSERASFIAPSVSKTISMKFKLTTIESYNCKDNQNSSCNHHKSSSTVKVTIEASKDGNKTTTTSTSTATKTVAIAGTITTAANAGIGGAVVSSSNKTSTSGSTGSYTLSQITTSGRTVVHATHPDYFDNSRVVIANISNNFSLDIKLSPILASQTFDSGEGTTLTQGQANVVIPANIKYLSESKKSYKGEVNIKMAYYDATDATGKSLLPGSYEGSDGSSYFPLYVHSFMHISLTDKDGNPLTVKTEDSIQLHFPNTSSINNAPQLATWSYSNTTGYWLKDGTSEPINGTYDIPANASGTYGLHTIAPFGTLNLCVEDSSNVAIEGANIVVRANNWDYPLIQTDSKGKVALDHVLASAPLTITASKVINGTLYTKNYTNTVTLSEGELQNLTDCIELGEARVIEDSTDDKNTTDDNSSR